MGIKAWLWRLLGGGELPKPGPHDKIEIGPINTIVPSEHILTMAGIACETRDVPSTARRGWSTRGNCYVIVERRNLAAAHTILNQYRAEPRSAIDVLRPWTRTRRR